jgi:hypothetical protein
MVKDFRVVGKKLQEKGNYSILEPMAIKQKKPVAFPRTAIKALELLSRPQAEILLHDNKAYVICGDKCLYLPDKPYQVLVSQDWITPPIAIDNEHAYCVITATGGSAT